MIRPRIDLDDTDHERVQEYADENGLRMSRAFADLIKEGLDSSTDQEIEA